jgi:hypothetical protein
MDEIQKHNKFERSSSFAMLSNIRVQWWSFYDESNELSVPVNVGEIFVR